MVRASSNSPDRKEFQSCKSTMQTMSAIDSGYTKESFLTLIANNLLQCNMSMQKWPFSDTPLYLRGRGVVTPEAVRP